MAGALVGTIGAVSVGSSGAAVTPAWGTSENRTANNLLVLWVGVTGSATVPATPSGWSSAVTVAGTTCSAGLFYKVAAGADAAPAVAAITSGTINARLAEYSGLAATSPISSTGSASGTSTPVKATNAAVDAASGCLMVSATSIVMTGSYANANDAPTYTNGTAIAVTNSGTAVASHYDFAYAFTTANAVADADSQAFTTTHLTGVAVALASFKAIVVETATGTATGTFAATATGTFSTPGTGSATGTFAATATGTVYTGPNVGFGNSGTPAVGSSQATSVVVSPSWTIGPSSALVLFINNGGGTNAGSVADNATTHYTWAQVDYFNEGGESIQAWVGTGGSGGSGLTVTVSGLVSGYNWAQLYEATMTAGMSVVQSHTSTGSASTSTLASLPVTPTSPGCAVIIGLASGYGWSAPPGAPWVSSDPNTYLGAAYLVSAVANSAYSIAWNLGSATGASTVAMVLAPPFVASGTGAATGTFTATAHGTLPTAFSSLVDTFQGSSINATIWTPSNTTQVTEGGGSLNIATTTGAAASYNLTSTGGPGAGGFYSLIGSSVSVQLVSAGNLSGISGYVVYLLLQDTSAMQNSLWYYISGANIAGEYSVNDVISLGAGPQTYSPTTHAWLRIRESGGRVYWDYSSDGNTWNSMGSISDSAAPFLAGFQFCFQVGTTSTTASATSASIAYLNSPAPITGTGSLSTTFAASAAGKVTIPSTGSVVGAFAATANGAFAATGALSGTFAASSTGLVRVPGTGSASGTFTASATGAVLVAIAGSGAATGVFTATGTGTVAAPSGASYDAVVALDNPTHWWKFGDASGTSYADSTNGTTTSLTGTGTITLGQAGIPGSSATAALFAAGAYALQNATAYALPEPISVECWVKSTVTTAGGTGGNGTYSQAPIVQFGSGASLDEQIGFASGTINGYSYPYSIASPLTYNDGNWHHIVLTMAVPGGNNGILYVDGVKVATGPMGYQSFSSVWDIGNAPYYSFNAFAGTIAHVAVYEGVVLTSGQVLAHYSAGSKTPITYASSVLVDGPVFYWRLNELTGTVAADTTGNGMAGTYSSSGITLGEPPAVQDGTSMYVTPPTGVSIPTFPAAQTYPFSIEMWVNVVYVGQWGTLFGKVTNSGWGDGFACYSTGNPNWDFWVSGYTLPGVTFPIPDAQGVFTHLVVTYDGTTGNVYLNGALAASGAMAPTNLTNAASLWVGQDGNGFGLDAYFDEVAFYSYLLSPARIAAHYSVGTTPLTVTTVPGTGAATTTFTATATGSVVFPSTAAMAGSFSASATATWVPVALGSGPVSAVFTASATGVVVFSVPGGLTGIFAATATGTSRLPGTGTAIGTFVASGTGLVTVAATGAIVGTFTALAATTGSGAVLGAFAATSVGLVVVPSHATLAGTFAASAAGALAGSGTATGSFTASAQGIPTDPAFGTFVGTFTGLATGTMIPVDLGTAALVGSFLGQGTGLVTVSATAAMSGSFLASATGTWRIPATGTATGSFTSAATGLVTVPSTATASGIFTAVATGTVPGLALGTGVLVGTFSASGTGLVRVPSTANAIGIFAANATSVIIGPFAATGPLVTTFTGSASGTSALPGHSGLVSTFTASAAGAINKLGSASLVSTFTATAAGVLDELGSGLALSTFTASAAGVLDELGSGAVVSAFLATATGTDTLPIALLVDDFNSGVFDPTIWVVNPPEWGFLTEPVSIVDGQVNITAVDDGSYGGVESVGYFDLTDSAVFTQLVSAGDQTTTSGFDVYPLFLNDANLNVMGWECITGTLYIMFPGLSSIPLTYNPEVHKWLRVRETGGFLYYDYSTDGIIWVNAYNGPDPTPDMIDLTALRCGFIAGAPGAAGPGMTAIFDNVNYLPPQPKIATLVDDFNSGVLDPAIWAVQPGPAVSVASGWLEMQTYDPAYGTSWLGQVTSVGYYDLTSSEIFIQVVDPDDWSSHPDLLIVPITLADTGTNQWYWQIIERELQIGTGDGSTDAISVGSYDPAIHRWFRIREADGTHYYDWSTDGMTWTTSYSAANEAPMIVLNFSITVGFNVNPVSTIVIFDNVNIVPPSIPKLVTLVDDFNSGLNTTVWDVNDPAEGLGGDALVDVVNGQLNITVGTGGVYGGIQCYEWFDLTGSEVIVQLVDAGTQTLLSSHDVWPIWVADTNGLGFGIEVQNGMVWSGFPAGINGPTATYDPAIHRWFRIRELGGTFYEEYSPDRMNWTTMFTSTNTFEFVPTTVQLSLQAGIPGMTESQTTAVFDNVNTFPMSSGSGRMVGVFRARAEGYISGPTPSWDYINRSESYNYSDGVLAKTPEAKPVDVSFSDAR